MPNSPEVIFIEEVVDDRRNSLEFDEYYIAVIERVLNDGRVNREVDYQAIRDDEVQNMYHVK